MASTPATAGNICVEPQLFVNPGGIPCALTFNFNYSGSPTAANAALDLQAALNAASCGFKVVLANIQYLGNINLPNQTVCSAGNWVWVTYDLTDATFPAEGRRIDPCYMGIPQNMMPYYPFPTWDTNPNTCARHMPQLMCNLTSGNSCFGFNPGSSTQAIAFWRFVGLEITRSTNYDLALSLVDLDYQPSFDCGTVGTGNSQLPTHADLCAADQPNHIIFDRCILHGDSQRQTAIGIKGAGTRFLAVIDSYGYDVGATFAGGAGDGHWYGWGTGHGYTNVGWGKFINNFTASSTMASEFCGAFVEPLSPVTGQDGIPQSILFSQDFFYKNPFWDSQIGHPMTEIISIEGQNYGPANNPESLVSPHSLQLAPGQSYTFALTWLNDSRGGLNRMNTNGGGSITVDGIANGNTTVGAITKNGEHNVGSAPWVSQNQITYTYTAPATTGSHTLVFTTSTINDIPANLGQNLSLTDTAVVNVVSAPAHMISLSPNAPDLSLQPLYSDNFFNTRQFCFAMFATANYTPTSLTWSVDGVTNGNSSVGTIQTSGSNVAYCSGTSTGAHIVAATDNDGTNGTSIINVSSSAPILGYDLKPYTSKNGWELKCGKRILYQNNFAELSWGSAGNGGGQDGTALLMQVGNQANQTNDGQGNNVGYGPEQISDITIDHSEWSHFGQDFVAAALNAALGEHRVTFQHLVCDDCTNSRWSHGFLKVNQAIQYSGTASSTKVLPWTSIDSPLIDNLTMNHLTLVGGTTTFPGVTNAFSLTNDIVQFGTGALTITNSILAANGSATFANNFGDTNDANQASGSGASNTEALAFQGTGWTPVPLASCPAPKKNTTLYCAVSDQPGVTWEISASTGTVAPYTPYAPPAAAPPGTKLASPYTFTRLALLDSTASPSVFSSPNIWQPASTDATLFRNYNNGCNGDYRVVQDGQYDAGGARDSADGTALGADVTGVNAAVTAAKLGTRTP